MSIKVSKQSERWLGGYWCDKSWNFYGAGSLFGSQDARWEAQSHMASTAAIKSAPEMRKMRLAWSAISSVTLSTEQYIRVWMFVFFRKSKCSLCSVLLRRDHSFFWSSTDNKRTGFVTFTVWWQSVFPLSWMYLLLCLLDVHVTI